MADYKCRLSFGPISDGHFCRLHAICLCKYCNRPACISTFRRWFITGKYQSHVRSEDSLRRLSHVACSWAWANCWNLQDTCHQSSAQEPRVAARIARAQNETGNRPQDVPVNLEAEPLAKKVRCEWGAMVYPIFWWTRWDSLHVKCYCNKNGH